MAAPFCAWYGEPWFTGIAYSTFFYFVGTLAGGIENAIKYKSWRIYQLWDIAIFILACTALLVYAIPRDLPGMSFKDWGALYRRGFWIGASVYFIGWFVVRLMFRTSVRPHSRQEKSPSVSLT